MTAQSKTVIKTYFETGDKPTQAQFVDLIDSYQDYDASISTLTSAAVGIIVKASAGGFASRGISGTANEITVTDTIGSAGNPTISLPTALAFAGKTVTGGTFVSAALTSPAITNASMTTPNIGVATATSINFGDGALASYRVSSYTGVNTGAISTNNTIRYVRVGNQVTLHVPVTRVSGASSANPITIAGLPADLNPATEMRELRVAITDNGTDVTAPGLMRLTSSGSFIIYKDIALGNFTSSGNITGYYGFSVTYTI